MPAHVVQSKQLRDLFLKDKPFLDVRAEVEFEKGTFPTSVNHPILNTDEREKVGLCYKEQGHDRAVELGHELVNGSVKDARVSAWREFVTANDEAHLYCWRGGMRSALAGEWLKDAGIDIPLVPGGYKALRQVLLDELDAITRDSRLLMIGGSTGTAKTSLVNAITTGVDLEGHANHRGSGFGRRVSPQPPQASFENALTIDLMKVLEAHPGEPIILENEGRNIGSVGIPANLADKMATSPLAVVDMPLESRVECILSDYVLDMLAEFELAYPGEGFSRYREYLIGSLDRIKKRLGGERHQRLRVLMCDALERHESTGDVSGHNSWIEPLMVDYYDPMTDYQLANNRDRIVFRGDYQQVLDGVRGGLA
jgi:tRNA 2-selenouridine synthase